MSAAPATLDRVLRERGRSAALDAFVAACVFDRAGGLAAFALGDGTLRLAPRAGDSWRTLAAHDGAVLSLADDGADGFLTGGDDGRLLRLDRDGTVSELRSFGSKWVERVASFADGKARLLACAVGKHLHLLDGSGAVLKVLEHPSTVTGIAFDAKGKRVAASHYNGASLWFVASRSDNPRRLDWKGSHTGIAFDPPGEHVVTTMQENALHGWRLADGQHMRMSGYPAKTASLGFTRGGKWLATAGAESVVLWPFFGGGPMGKAPMELAGMAEGTVCTQVACHPRNEVVAAGFSDGVVVVADIASQRILPVAGPGRGPISALAWSGDGGMLACGSETGFAALVDFSPQ